MADAPPADRSASQPIPLPPLPDRGPVGVSIPALLTSFLGRTQEVGRVAALLRQDGVRLVTLTGPGGVGKTRLARRVAEVLAGDFADGVAFVDLTPLADSDLVAETVAQVLDVRAAGDRPVVDRLRDALRNRALLLVLDNFEHVLAAAPLVGGLLAACPHLRVMATSREVLRLSGEHAVAVHPLALPEAGDSAAAIGAAEAVQLFVARARAARDDFALCEANAPAIAEVCRRLDGLPLAIELAAARVTHLPPAAFLARLEQRLPLLTGGPRDAPARLQTMRAAIGWSYDLLSTEEQILFRRLAVFVGGCTLEAAEAVACDRVDTLDGIASLVAKSLLREEDGPDGEPRFDMLVTIREYGLEQLKAGGEAEDVHQRHARYILQLAEAAKPHLRGGTDRHVWHARLDAERDNVRAALAWTLATGDGETALRLAVATGRFWVRRGLLQEGQSWLERALLVAPDASTTLRAQALHRAAIVTNLQGDLSATARLAKEALELFRALGDRAGTADALTVLSWGTADIDQAMVLAEESLALARAVGDEYLIMQGLREVGYLLAMRGDIAGAQLLCEEAVQIARRPGNEVLLAWAVERLAHIRQEAGDLAGAEDALRESLVAAWEENVPLHILHVLERLAEIAALQQQPIRATRLFGAAAGLAQAIGLPISDDPTDEHKVATLREVLGEAPFAAAWAAGQALPLEAAVVEALAEFPAPVAPVSAMSAHSLTPRERDVLQLLVEGRSDREIAEALGVSYRTVTSYVRNILDKLNVVSRTAAATQAVRRGLV